MLDLLLRRARLPGRADLQDIGVRDGVIAAPEPEASQVVDLEGSLVTPALVEPHIHLDAVLTVGEPRQNESGSLFEGIAIWADRVKQLTVDDVKRRGRTVLRWQLANGVQFVRSHVDVCDPELRAVRALLELRQEIGDQMTLQLVAFPQQGIMSFDGGEELMKRAIDMGAGRFYFNCGTWIRLLRLADSVLRDIESFRPVYKVLINGRMDAIDGAIFGNEPFVMDRTTAVCIKNDGDRVIGELAHVVDKGSSEPQKIKSFVRP